MSQCVPSWDLDDNPTHLKLSFSTKSTSSNTFPADVPSLDYEVAELTWENGQLAMYGLGTPRVHNKPAGAAWEKLRAADTLESIVDQATSHPYSKNNNNNNKLVPWLDHRYALPNPAGAGGAAVDALVPCNNARADKENSTHVPGTGVVGSCSGGACLARGCCKSYASAGESATCGGGDSRQLTLDSCDREFGGGGITSTSLWSPENTSSGEDYTKTSTEEHEDAGVRSRLQKGNRKLSVSARAAAVHNQSERRRRDKINQRMKTLQKLVPNSSKTDKASMLDEVIEYLKQLQAQVQMMSRMNMPSMHMMMPLPMQQQLQMSMMAPAMGMAHAMGMGMGVMDINAMGRVGMMPPPPNAAFMSMPSWDIHAGDRMQFPPITPDFLSAFFACQAQAQAQDHVHVQAQAQPMTVDAYSRLAALYQQFQQSSAASGSKN